MKFILICAGMFAAAFSANAKTETRPSSLLTEVTVQDRSVTLRDLLPPDAGPRLKLAAEKVSFGRAPEPGSLRVFTASELTKAIAESAGLGREFAAIIMPEQVVVRRGGWPIDIEAVRRTVMRSALAGKFNFPQMRIMLPADLTTARSSPQFEVTAITPTPDRLGLFARVRCRERAACGSFLAEIVSSVPGVLAKWRGPRSELLASAGSFKQTIDSATFPGPVLVQPGRLALLMIEGEGFRITEPVMPLKGARLGEFVRVSDPKSQRSWLAQVAGSGQLRTPGITVPKEAR
jgi:hypothetical protein